MKKYLKIIVLILILCTSRIKGVSAESFYEDNWISGVYANLIDGEFSKPQLMRFIRRKSDNKASYCITPRVLLYEDETYNMTSNINLTNNQKKRIERLAYFGYGYKNHTSDEWYAITQFMIWKTVEPNMDIFFTDTKGGNRINRFTNEINELNSLVNEVDDIPNIPSINILPNSNKQVEDSNHIINRYKLTVPNGIEVNMNNDTLDIKSQNKGMFTLQFDLSYDRFNSNPYYYSASRGQKILVPGKLTSINYQVDINVISSKINLSKQDSNTNELLEGAVYDLYDNNYNYIDTVTTDKSGQASFSNLLYGTYYLLETKAPIGYQIDNSFHEVTLNYDYHNITLSNDKISATLILHKFISDKFMFIPEKNVEYEVYDMDDNLVSELVTDSYGITSIVLTYGKYKIHQKTSKEGYQKVDDFYIEVLDSDDIVYYIKDDKIVEEDPKEPEKEEKQEEPKKEETKEIVEVDQKNEENKKEKLKEVIEEKIIPKEIKKETIIENPKTGDYMIYIYIVLGYIAFIAIMYIISLLKKK